MGSHSNLGASGMYRWANCTMSPSLIETLDPELRNRSSKAAEEGSSAHRLCDLGTQWISEKLKGGAEKSVLRDVLLYELIGLRIAKYKGRDDWEVVGNDPFSGDFLCADKDVELGWEYNVFTCNEEMQDGVRRYLSEILDVIEQCGSDQPVVRPETKCYPMPSRPDIYGTSDCVIFDPATRRLWVIDFKFGRGIVSAIDNLQALFYAAGAYEDFSLDGYTFPGDGEVTLMIVQPRVTYADGRDVSDQTLTIRDLNEWTKGTLVPAVKATETPALAKYEIGSWCRFCPAAAVCPLMQREAVRKAQEAFADELETLAFEDVPDVELVMPDAGDPGQLSSALKIAKVLEIWTIRVREMADVVGKTTAIPGFKLVRKQTKRRWRDDAEVIDALGGNFDGHAPSKPKTPAQMEKSGALSQEEIDELSVKPEGGLTLAPEGDRRKAVELAANAFPIIEG